jgi:hypothetical protein
MQVGVKKKSKKSFYFFIRTTQVDVKKKRKKAFTFYQNHAGGRKEVTCLMMAR